MERTGQWVFSQAIPTDVVVEVGNSSFPLHKFMLVAKSGFIRRAILDSSASDVAEIKISDLPGGAEAFEKAARFCYGVNFEISVYNVAALRCAAEYLEMTEEHCEGNLARRTEEFVAQAALKTLPASVALLRSCEGLLPMAEELGIVQQCVDVIGLKACNESSFPTRSPPEWWATELGSLPPTSFQKILSAMKSRGASPKTLATAIAAFAERSLPDLLSRKGGAAAITTNSSSSASARQRTLLESIVSLLPPNCDAPLPIGFLCLLLRSTVSLSSSAASRRELERRIAASLDQATVGDLLSISLDVSGERVEDLDSVRRIVSLFVEQETTAGAGGVGGGLFYGGGGALCSATLQKVARIVDSFVGEIATDEELSVSKFAGLAGALPKSARRFDDDLYRAVDIYLKAHPGLEEIEREKVCSVMDPLKLSYEARLHAAQNKRLPLQIVLHALYYDQLQLRSGGAPADNHTSPAAAARSAAKGDASLAKENEVLRSELARMRMYLSDLERTQGGGGSVSKPSASAAAAVGPKKPKFFASVSRTLGKLNPFKNGSKDTSSIEESGRIGLAKPRKRRFSIS
ncbi:root phototropism protein 2 [Typha latifolia]|uniref:root phototropism protein 2 n=1 Tax=Typha latifolia TaxID=4733 RepID=UPI003C2CB2EC